MQLALPVWLPVPSPLLVYLPLPVQLLPIQFAVPILLALLMHQFRPTTTFFILTYFFFLASIYMHLGVQNPI
jgi:hypothetical protein